MKGGRIRDRPGGLGWTDPGRSDKKVASACLHMHGREDGCTNHTWRFRIQQRPRMARYRTQVPVPSILAGMEDQPRKDRARTRPRPNQHCTKKQLLEEAGTPRGDQSEFSDDFRKRKKEDPQDASKGCSGACVREETVQGRTEATVRMAERKSIEARPWITIAS